MDLLSAVMHELGHVLGFDDIGSTSEDLMSATLDAGTRRDVDIDAIADQIAAAGSIEAVSSNNSVTEDTQSSETEDETNDPPGSGKGKMK